MSLVEFTSTPIGGHCIEFEPHSALSGVLPGYLEKLTADPVRSEAGKHENAHDFEISEVPGRRKCRYAEVVSEGKEGAPTRRCRASQRFAPEPRPLPQVALQVARSHEFRVVRQKTVPDEPRRQRREFWADFDDSNGRGSQ